MEKEIGDSGDEYFKVKASADPLKLGSAIAHTITSGHDVVLKAIGAGAINQAMKSVLIAKSFVAASGIRLLTDPFSFQGEVEDDGKPEKIQGLAIRVFRA